MKGTDLKGAFVAIVTPFRNGKIDEKALEDLVEFQINNGTHGIVACGTTGESATLSHTEHNHVIELVVKAVNKRVPVIAGTGSNNTVEAIELTKHAKKVGADASLSICPYYNKPTQEGVCQHFEVLANECGLPIILYNIPGRTGINMTSESILHLAKLEHVIGIKEASGSLDQVSEILAKCPSDFAVLSGDDSLTLSMMALGAMGVISTTSNVAPKLMSELCNLALQENFVDAREIHFKLFPLFKALFCESNPVPAKTALSLMGAMSNEIRLPLAVLKPESTELIQKVIKELELI